MCFSCNVPNFQSGAEGSRTPDFRRAKSDSKSRGVRRRSPGLVYYWCTDRTSKTGRTRAIPTTLKNKQHRDDDRDADRDAESTQVNRRVSCPLHVNHPLPRAIPWHRGDRDNTSARSTRISWSNRVRQSVAAEMLRTTPGPKPRDRSSSETSRRMLTPITRLMKMVLLEFC